MATAAEEQVQEAMDRLDMDLDEIMEFVIEFCANTLGQIQRCEALTQSAQPTDVEELARLLHTMYGSSAMLGLDEVSQHAYDIDEALNKERFAEDPSRRNPSPVTSHKCVTSCIEPCSTLSAF